MKWYRLYGQQNKREERKIRRKINSLFFAKIHKNNKLQIHWLWKRREDSVTQNKKWICGHYCWIYRKKRIWRKYYVQLYINWLDNPDKMDKFLEKLLPKWNQEEVENLNRPITSKTMESIIQKVLWSTACTTWFHCWFLPNIKNYLTILILKCFPKKLKRTEL